MRAVPRLINNSYKYLLYEFSCRYYSIEKVLKPRTHGNDFENIFNTQARFPYYMAQLIGADQKPSSQAQLTWVNALLGRLFWDVWKSEYWNTKAKKRIQNKISRMKLPPFIRYLKVGFCPCTSLFMFRCTTRAPRILTLRCNDL